MDLHGGNTYKFEREGKKDILDYSSNINPLGIPKSFIEKATKNFEILTKYPDPDYIELREKIAKHNNLKIENIIVGNGATEILFLYMRALKPKKVLLIAPCFAEYKRALDSIQAKIDYFKLKEDEDFILNVEELEKKLELDDYDLLLLCNPNNPTGKFVSLKKIKKILNIVEKKKINFFIDEAFIEFIENWEEKNASLLNSKNIFIMRAFTKFFAIPGLRLGYGISFDSELTKKMLKEKEPWSVNNFANLAGLTVLDDFEYIEKSKAWIREEKKFMYDELKKFSNIKVYETETNFILIKLFNITSTELGEKMIEKKVLIRNASNFKFLNDKFIRIAIKDRKNNMEVLKKLSEIVEWRG